MPDIEPSAGDKAANGTNNIPTSLPSNSQALAPAFHPRHPSRVLCRGGRDGSAVWRAGSSPRVPQGGCLEKRHECSEETGQKGTSVGNRGRKRPGLSPAAEVLPLRLLGVSPAVQSAPVARGRAHRDAEGSRGSAARASFSMFTLPRGARAQPAPVRPSPGLAFRVSLFLSGIALLYSFLATSLCPTRLLSTLLLQEPLYCARIPSSSGLLTARLRLPRTPKPASREALGSPFAGSGPRSVRREKGDSRVLPSACL